MKETKENKLAVKVLADKPLVAKNSISERILEIAITAPEKQKSVAKAPLNLSLVIDRSGSMAGEKLEYVKRAAAHVVDLLSEEDRAAIVVYDDTIDVLYPSTFMTAGNKQAAKRKIEGIDSGASTNLFGGWLKGCEQVAEAATERSFNRTLLLTDGQANVGITSLGELSHHARELFNRGVSTSCFGVGLGYNEHILEAMSSFGGGNFHFLETVSAIPVVFEREFLELVSISLRKIEICLDLKPGMKVVVSGGYLAEQVGHSHKIHTGSVAAGQTQYTYVRLTIPKALTDTEVTIPIKIVAKGEDNESLEAETSISFRGVTEIEEKAYPADKSVMERFVVVDMADTATEALKRERAGDRAGSSRLMRESLNMNSPYMSGADSSKFSKMSQMFETGLDEQSRKTFHQRSYMNKRGRGLVVDYPLQQVNGSLIAKIGGQVVLIDSGAPTSAGRMPDWIFFDQFFKLAPEAMGVSVDHLSQQLGTKVDVLLGMDILQNLFVTLDLANERIEFNLFSPQNSNAFLKTAFERVPLKFANGVPVCEGVISGNAVRLVVDTGSTLTLLPQGLLDKLPAAGKETDFHPGIGRFDTNVVKVPMKLGHQKMVLRCGTLPQALDVWLSTLGGGILGTEIYSQSKVCLAFPDKEMILYR